MNNRDLPWRREVQARAQYHRPMPTCPGLNGEAAAAGATLKAVSHDAGVLDGLNASFDLDFRALKEHGQAGAKII